MMAWHIFRKDWRLMWPLAVGVVLLQVLIMVVIRHSDPFPLSGFVSGTAALLTFGLAVAMTLLIVLTIQQEAIASVNQDWLTRPVKRQDLLLGKLLTMGLLIHGPIVAVNILQGLGEGFSLGSVLRATLDSNFEVALCYSLPVMAIAAMTRSVVEAIIFGLVVLVISVSLGIVTAPTGGTGLKWIWRSVAHTQLLVMTIVALGWQYSRRSREGTQQARAIFAVGVALFGLIPLLPWGWAFSLQRSFAAHPEAAQPVAIDIAMAHKHDPLDLDPLILTSSADLNYAPIALPLHFSNVPAGAIVHVDRTVVRLIRGDGTVAYRALGRKLDIRGGGVDTVRQSIDIPTDVYSKLADQSLRLEVTYFATLMRSVSVPQSLAVNDARRVPGFGWCAARARAAKGDVEVGCRQIGALPFCVSMSMGRGPEKFVCEMNYEPVPLRFSVDPIDHVETELGMSDGEVSIRVYEPEAHFSRELVLPASPLADWRRESFAHTT